MEAYRTYISLPKIICLFPEKKSFRSDLFKAYRGAVLDWAGDFRYLRLSLSLCIPAIALSLPPRLRPGPPAIIKVESGTGLKDINIPVSNRAGGQLLSVYLQPKLRKF